MVIFYTQGINRTRMPFKVESGIIWKSKAERGFESSNFDYWRLDKQSSKVTFECIINGFHSKFTVVAKLCAIDYKEYNNNDTTGDYF